MKLIAVLLFLFAGERVSAWKEEQRPVAAAKKFRCLLVFGDSTVDPGNNNYLNTTLKANFKPYGINFFGGRPTGRHSDGRLSSDFIAQSLGISKSVPAFLDPKLTGKQRRHGVSFASAGAGLDNLTDAALNVLPFNKQIELLKEYKSKLHNSMGSHKAAKTLKHSLVIIIAGTNDFIQNYFVTNLRSKQFTVPQYVDFLIAQLLNYIEEIHKNGPRVFVVSDLGPIGCLPVIRKLFGHGSCFAPMNDAALYYNSKLVTAISELKQKLDITVLISASYEFMYEAITTPEKFGFTVAEIGCCGSGFMEYGETCKGKKLCSNPRSHVFFDAVHPSERMYKLMANNLFSKINKELMV